jgi:PAS domain-containing protein
MLPPRRPAPDALSDSRLQDGLDYWRGKLAGRPMPRRADIDPVQIPSLLQHLMLIDVLANGRYRYRLIGTGNVEAQGLDATGRYLDEVLPGPAYKAHVLKLYDECIRAKRPLYWECLFFSPHDRRSERRTQALFLPLSEDGISVNQVLVVQVFFYIDQSTRERHFIDAPPFKEIDYQLL